MGRFQLITIYNLDTLISPKMTFLYGLAGIDRTGKVRQTSSPNLPYFQGEQKFLFNRREQELQKEPLEIM